MQQMEMELRETYYEVRSHVDDLYYEEKVSYTFNILEAKRLLREEKALGRDVSIFKVALYEELLEEYE
jgi:hypothetical protein